MARERGRVKIKHMLEKRIFTSSRLRVQLGHEALEVDALVSVAGAKNVLRGVDGSALALAWMGQEVDVEYRGHPLRARIVRESGKDGTVFNLRFTRLDPWIADLIRKDVEFHGLPSPWRRGLPRLPAQADHLPVPSVAVVYFRGQEFLLGVRNFTLGGLLLEHVGDELQELVFGQKMEFDLLTNFGERLNYLSARVAHVTEEIDEQAGVLVRRMQFGLEFMPMNLLNSTKYRALIREFCLGWKSGRA